MERSLNVPCFSETWFCSCTRIEDKLVLGSVGFHTGEGFQASALFEDDCAQRAGPRSCSPPPSPPLPSPGNTPVFFEGDLVKDKSSLKEKIQKPSSTIKERVKHLEQELKTPLARERESGEQRCATIERGHFSPFVVRLPTPSEPEESAGNHQPSARGPGRSTFESLSEARLSSIDLDKPPTKTQRPDAFAVAPDRVVFIEEQHEPAAPRSTKAAKSEKGAFDFLGRFKKAKEKGGEEIMAGVPPPPSSGVDMAMMATLLQRFAEEPVLQNPTSDNTWKGKPDGITVKLYAPLSSKNLRQTCGVSDKAIIESFLDTANTAAAQQRRLGTVKKRGVFSKEEDQILLAPAGPYAAKTISAQECKYLTRVASRYVEHFQDCQNSLLPRFYFILRINKGGRIKSTEHWVVTDNLNDLPLPVRLTYDLKGVGSRHTKVSSGNEPLVVLKEGNLAVHDGIQRLPQVSPWGTRQLLEAITVDCSILEELKATNYSLLVLFCPASGEVEEMNYVERAPRRPPYIRLDGQDCTLFAVLVDCLQEWAPVKAAGRILSFFRGPTKVVEAFGLTPNRYSVRLKEFLEAALGEDRTREENLNTRWSDAVRTKAANNLTPQTLPPDLIKNTPQDSRTVSPETHSHIRPLSMALTSKEIELQQKRLSQARSPQSTSSAEQRNLNLSSTSRYSSHFSPTSISSPIDGGEEGWDYPSPPAQLRPIPEKIPDAAVMHAQTQMRSTAPAAAERPKLPPAVAKQSPAVYIQTAGNIPEGSVPLAQVRANLRKSNSAAAAETAAISESEKKRRAEEKRAKFLQESNQPLALPVKLQDEARHDAAIPLVPTPIPSQRSP